MFWTWLVNALLTLAGWFLKVEAAPVAAEARQTGAATEAASEAVQGEKAAQAMAQAQQDAPKDRAGVEKEMRGGGF